MRVAIAGSTGLLGEALVRYLTESGHDVLRLVRREPVRPGERLWDPTAGRIARPGLDDVDAVVNLAATGIGDRRWTAARKREILLSRTQGTLTLVHALHPDGRCQRLLNGSAIGFYGSTGDRIVDEDSPAGSGFLAGVVVEWEAAASHAPVPTALLRTGPVLARHGGYLAKQWLVFALGLGGRIGDGRQYLSWISLADHVRAMAFLLTSPLTGPVNLVAPEPVTNADFTRALGAYLHRPTPLPLPLPAVRLLFGREFVTDAVLSGCRVRPSRLLEAGFEFRHPRVAQALAALDQPVHPDGAPGSRG